MQTTLTTTLRLMMTKKPQEVDLHYKDKEGNEKSRVREFVQAYLLGTGAPLTTIDININKYVAGNTYRHVKITDLYEKFIDHKADLMTGKKVLLAHVELVPQKNNFSENGVINSFTPYLTGYDIAEPTEADATEVASIMRVAGSEEKTA
jgi:hypothetical protein